MRYSIITACGLLLATQAFAADEPEYVATVQKAYAPDAHVKRVAIAPISCPEELDCGDLQKELGKLLNKRTDLDIISSDDTQKMMERASISRIDFETRYILAEGMKVDAIVTLEVQRAGVEMIEGAMTKVGDEEVRDAPTKIKHVKLAMEMAMKDGTTVVQAVGEGKVSGSLKSVDSVAKHTLEALVEQAVPKAE